MKIPADNFAFSSSETLLFIGAGATAKLDMPTTVQQGEILHSLCSNDEIAASDLSKASYYEKVKRLTLSLVIFFLLFVKLRLKGQRTTICKYFYSLAIKIVFCLRFGQKSDTIIDDNS